MAELSQRLLDDLKSAVRTSNVTHRDVIRYLRSAIHNQEIERGRALTDNEIIDVIQRQIKQRRESIEHFQKAGRQDLVDVEAGQIEVLQAYLPPQLSYEEVVSLAREMALEVGASGPRDMSKLMPRLQERIGTQAEGRIMAQAAREVLQSLSADERSS